MTIGRTDDPENPFGSTAPEAAALFGAGSRIPSGPAAMLPRQQAGHMIAIDPIVAILDFSSCIQGAVHTWASAILGLRFRGRVVAPDRTAPDGLKCVRRQLLPPFADLRSHRPG